MKKKKYKISVAIFTALTILTMGGCTFFANKKSETEQTYYQPVIDITYCDVNSPSKLCIASFGTENGEKTLINLIVTDLDIPDFNINIQRNGVQSVYECERTTNFPNSIYCVGEKISLGDLLELEVVSKVTETLIAKGNLNISFLSVSTPIASISTKASGATSSPLQVTPSQTPTPQAIFSTETTPTLPAATETVVSSYGNPAFTETAVDSYKNPTK